MRTIEIDYEGRKKVLDVIDTFENNNIKYIIYLDKNMFKNEILASRYIEEKEGEITLLAIESDAEWDMIDKRLEELNNE